MSAFMVSDLHLNAIVTYASNQDISIYLSGCERVQVKGNEQAIIEILATANAESLHVRYGDDDLASAVKYEPTHKYQSPMQIIKLCQCFDYQACEVADYEKTPAAIVTRAIIEAATMKLPGYDDLEWSV